MKKETLIAIIFGIVFGGLFSLLIINVTKKNIPQKKEIGISPKEPTIIISPIIKQELELTTPKNEEIISKDTVTIKGKAAKDSLLIIQSPQEEKIIKLTNVNFAEEVKLNLGENIIKVTNYQKNNVEQKTLKIYYLKD